MPEKLLNYDVMRRLGEGAASTIYAVRDPGTGRMYALKHVERKKPKDLRFIDQMEAEFQISKQFTHPNLRKSYELKISKSLLMKVTEAFLVMELVEGKPLDVRPTPRVQDVLATFMHVALALRAMHQLGYVHCDIKPNNILQDDAGNVRVIDFGQSCKIGTTKERIQGTPDYIAPEQVNRQPVTVQTDVYNLGATLYWALTGINSPTLYTTNRQGENSFLLDSRIQTPGDLNPLVSPSLSKLVMDCISTRRDKRPIDMDAVVTRLELARHAMQKRVTEVASAPTADDSDIRIAILRPPEEIAPAPVAVSRPAPAEPPPREAPAQAPPAPLRPLPAAPVEQPPAAEPPSELPPEPIS